MSDLFKRHRPRLSEDEERALWERVREIPRASGRARETWRRPWWGALWATPAMRYGAPAMAVALVAVVWVTQRDPVAPVRQERATAPSTPAPAPAEPGASHGVPGAVPAAPPADLRTRTVPAPTPTTESRDEAFAPAPVPDRTPSTTEVREEATSRRLAVVGQRAAEGRQDLSTDVSAGASGTAPPAGGYAVAPSAKAPPPPSEETVAPQSVREEEIPDTAPLAGAAKARGTTTAEPQRRTGFIRDDPRTGTIRRADGAGDAHVSALRAARGDHIQAALLGDRILVEVLAPASQGTFVAMVTLPISGGTARIAASTRDGALWVEADRVRDLVRIAGSEGEAGASTRRRVDLTTGPGGAGAAAIVAPDRRALTSHFVAEDGDERAPAVASSGPRARAAALAAELILAVASGDPRAVARVNDAAARLRAERPNDEAARALLAWSQDARTAFESR